MGTRLRPLTLNTPKCLVEINGEKLLLNWLNKLKDIGCDEVLINTHYLSSEVEKVIKKWDNNNLKVTITYEKRLLGTAGTLRENLEFFKNSDVLLIHADNYTELNLLDFLNSFYLRDKKCLMSMVTFRTDNPEGCGIVKTDEEGILEDYFEKISEPPCNIANGAIFAFDQTFLDYFSLLPSIYNDFCADIVPKLKGKIQTYFTSCLLIDIGTPKSLRLAREFSKIKVDNQ